MSSVSLTAFERDLSKLTTRLLEEYRPLIGEAGLVASFSGVEVRDTRALTRCSEVTITFTRSGEFADIMEFFAERNGSPNVTLAEAEAWLRRELADLPRRHARKMNPDP